MNLWNILVAKFKKSKMHTARTEQKDISQSSELTASYISQKYLNYNYNTNKFHKLYSLQYREMRIQVPGYTPVCNKLNKK
jgi:hypothetical protein